MSPDALPKFVYKIIPTAPPTPLPAAYPLSELDKNDGFVHLSTSEQVPNTCDLFFNNVVDLWVLKLDFSKVEADIKWEGGFPHLYRNFGNKEVESSHNFTRTESEKWSEAMKGSSFLEE